MRIGIVGLGAIGGVVAERLQARLGSGDELQLAAGRSAAALQARFGSAVGATLRNGPFDLILLCTRTADTAAALGPAAPLLAPDGAVVCLQNGLPEERAAAIVGSRRVLGAVIGWSASFEPPDRYVVTGGGRFTLGGESPRLADARAVLGRAFPVRVTDNLAGARWSKLAMNCAMSTLGAVSGLSLGELVKSRATRTLALRVLAEAAGVARERGVRLEPVAGIRPDLLLALPAAAQHAAIWLAAMRRPRQRSGMIARLREGRPAGVEDLNALVPRPLNARLVAMVHEIERGARPIGPGNLAELAA